MNNLFSKKTKKAFTLIELLIVIAIIIILFIGFGNFSFKGQQDKEELDKKVNLIISNLEELKFDSMLGKSFKNVIPEKRKIVIFTGSNNEFFIEKWYLSGGTWNKTETTKIKRPGFFVNNFFCKNLNDNTEIGSFDGSGEIIFEGRNIYLSGGDCSDIKYQELEIDLQLRNFKRKILLNTISGNIKKEIIK